MATNQRPETQSLNSFPTPSFTTSLVQHRACKKVSSVQPRISTRPGIKYIVSGPLPRSPNLSPSCSYYTLSRTALSSFSHCRPAPPAFVAAVCACIGIALRAQLESEELVRVCGWFQLILPPLPYPHSLPSRSLTLKLILPISL